MCSDENGTLSWEFEEDCVAPSYEVMDDFVYEYLSTISSGVITLEWWQDTWYSWGLDFTGYYSEEGGFHYCYNGNQYTYNPSVWGYYPGWTMYWSGVCADFESEVSYFINEYYYQTEEGYTEYWTEVTTGVVVVET